MSEYTCPYCGVQLKKRGSHELHCEKNPANMKPDPKPQEIKQEQIEVIREAGKVLPIQQPQVKPKEIKPSWWHRLSVSWHIPFLGKWKTRKAKELAAKQEAAAGRGRLYKEFEAFMLDLPTYCLNEDKLSKLIRKIFEAGGVKYQKIVIIDPGSKDDKYLYVRRQNDFYLHDGGSYIPAFKCSKDIFYYKKGDSRPLIDEYGDIFNSPDFAADLITALRNKATMESLSDDDIKEIKQSLRYALYILGFIGLILIIIAAYEYNSGQVIDKILAIVSKKP